MPPVAILRASLSWGMSEPLLDEGLFLRLTRADVAELDELAQSFRLKRAEVTRRAIREGAAALRARGAILASPAPAAPPPTPTRSAA